MNKNIISEFRGDFSFLSNFSKHPVYFKGEKYPTAEHAFQAQKAFIKSDKQKFLNKNLSAAGAKKLGRRIKCKENWDDKKVRIMYDVVKSKFSQNKELKNNLLVTNDKELIEGNYWGDTFWGVCEGVGENILGKILMIVRGELKEKERVC